MRRWLRVAAGCLLESKHMAGFADAGIVGVGREVLQQHACILACPSHSCCDPHACPLHRTCRRVCPRGKASRGRSHQRHSQWRGYVAAARPRGRGSCPPPFREPSSCQLSYLSSCTRIILPLASAGVLLIEARRVGRDTTLSQVDASQGGGGGGEGSAWLRIRLLAWHVPVNKCAKPGLTHSGASVLAVALLPPPPSPLHSNATCARCAAERSSPAPPYS